MDIEQAVVKALGTAAPGKVYAAAAIKGAAAPFIFYILHRDEAVEELDGDTALRAATFEVDAVGKGAKDLAALGAKVTAALKALRHQRRRAGDPAGQSYPGEPGHQGARSQPVAQGVRPADQLSGGIKHE